MNAHGIDPLLLRRACERFDERFGAAGRRVSVAPGRVNAYVCRGVTCLEPVSEMAALRRLLGGAGIK